MNLTRQVIRQAQDRAQLVSQQVFFQAQNALADAGQGRRSAGIPTAPKICAPMCRKSLDESDALTSSIDAEVVYSP